jgi:DNA-binding NtrC family response regulator
MGGSGMATVLIVEDHRDTCEFFARAFDALGPQRIVCAKTGEEAVLKVREERPQVMILEIMLPDMHGREVLHRARAIDPSLDVVVVTGHGDVQLSFEMGREGVEAFLEKGRFELADLVGIVTGLIESRERDAIKDTSPEALLDFVWSVGESQAYKDVTEKIEKFSRSDENLAIVGEYGTCKKAVAALVHRKSRRGAGPFVDVDCRSIPPDNAEWLSIGGIPQVGPVKARALWRARSGTLLLRHITDFPLAVQPMAVRVMEMKSYRLPGVIDDIRADVRVIVTSTENLASLVEGKRLRREFLAHLEPCTIDLPPLRARRKDIPLLAEKLLERARIIHGKEVLGFSTRAMRDLQRRPWPGNFFELWSVISHAVAVSKTTVLSLTDLVEPSSSSVTASSLKTPSGVHVTLQKRVEQTVASSIREALDRAEGNRSEAARILDVPKTTFQRKLKRHLPENMKK